MKIAMLGWGSLLWEGGSEFDKWHGPWKFDGPTIPLEFSRISKKRIGALTLVIDESNGSPTKVAWCLSNRQNAKDAMSDLRARECTNLENIGVVDLSPTAGVPNDAGVNGRIYAWAKSQELNVVIWTALKSNFRNKTKQPFSVESALSYLETLTPDAKLKAAEYIIRAPEFVRTPLRLTLQTESSFLSVCSPFQTGRLSAGIRD